MFNFGNSFYDVLIAPHASQLISDRASHDRRWGP